MVTEMWAPVNQTEEEAKRLRSSPKAERPQTHRIWRADGPPDSRVFQREHWSGRLDGRVIPQPISVDITMRNPKVMVDPAVVLRGTAGLRRLLARALFNSERGAITSSGLLGATWQDIVDATQLAVDLDLETHKGALFDDTITPNFTTDTAYGVAPYDANEVSGGSWPAGGVALTSTAMSLEAGTVLTFDAADVSVATTTLASAMGYLLYADALVGNNGILLVDFVTAVSTANGTFQITWVAPASGGIFNIDLVP